MKLMTYILTLILLSSFLGIPNNYLKKIDKEVQAIFNVEGWEKIPMSFDKEVLEQMSSNFEPAGFYKIRSKKEDLGFFYLGKARSKADDFDYVVIFDKEKIIRKIKILAYREDYGGEISSKRWLKQFDGLGTNDRPELGSDVMGISGATISTRSMTKAVNELLMNLSKLPI